MAQILAGPGARAPPSLPIHLVEEILIRVASTGDLVRASAACASFRRLVTDASFLRRYRSLHPPLLLGVVTYDGGVRFLPAEAPHPNALAAQSFARAADFSFDYLPGRSRNLWAPCDACEGRVLLRRWWHGEGLNLWELAVCDPLTREYSLLPPIQEDDLVASTLDQLWGEGHYISRSFDAFFVPSGDFEETQFRVICWKHFNELAVVFVYSSISGSWTHTSISWDALGFPEFINELICARPSYAYGCFYWTGNCNKLLKLDINRMEFSAVSLPHDQENWKVFIFEDGGGRFGILKRIFNHGNPEGNSKPLRYSVRQNVEEDVSGFEVETIIPLSSDYDHYYITRAEDGYIFLHGSQTDMTKSAFFSLEIKTLNIERVCSTPYESSRMISYVGFPPFISPRRI